VIDRVNNLRGERIREQQKDPDQQQFQRPFGMQEGDAGKTQQGSERGGLGAGLDAIVDIGHADQSQAPEQQKQRTGQEQQGADEIEKCHDQNPFSRKRATTITPRKESSA
jgi:hypothetical protein